MVNAEEEQLIQSPEVIYIWLVSFLIAKLIFTCMKTGNLTKNYNYSVVLLPCLLDFCSPYNIRFLNGHQGEEAAEGDERNFEEFEEGTSPKI